ncbi:MAG: SDR family oxidoreductase [Roseiarcus sp.]|jgi:NAD(P)-dependent dehydrogenase (short-subunit alcohol dehydrogenase family)|uniref:SDR family oxidoreductase n=1 Tax=Roseiarcus sp. TaxID=1969460 RepID=UPI003C1C39DE
MAEKSKFALVTGASSGIGRAVALGLARAGYVVAIAGRRQDALDAVAREIGPAALAIASDVSDDSSVTALFEAVRRKFGRLDLLFNNAGTNVPAVPLEELGAQQWKSVIDTNLSGVFYCVQQAFTLMKQQDPQGGRIINNGSISSEVPRPNSAPYTASKHGVTGLTKAASLDGRKYNIAVGQIDIGNAATDMTTRMSTGVLQADLSVRPEPRIALDQVVKAVLFMASLPPDANVQWLTVLPVTMPYIGRG